MVKSCLDASPDFSCQDLHILGAIYFVICILCLVPYFIVLKVIISNKVFVQHYSYKIMIHLGIMDIGQLVFYYVIYSLMLLTNSNFGFFISKVSTAISNGTWVGEASMVFLLGINRFVKLIDIQFPILLREKMFYNFLFGLAWFWSLFNFFVMCLPNMGALLYPDDFVNEEGNSFITVDMIFSIQDWYILVVLAITCCLYVITVFYLIIERRLMTSKTQVIVAHEWRLLLQGIFICLFKSVICGMWDYYTPPTKIPYIIFICFSIIESGYNPYLYFVTNKTLRQYVFNFIFKKESEIVMINVTNVKTRPITARTQARPN